MSFSLINPPEDQAGLEILTFELMAAAEALGLTLDQEGFITSWLSGTKILIERDADDKIVSMAFMVHGQKWFDNQPTATILRAEGNREKIIEYAKSIASVLGVKKIYYELNDFKENEDGSIENTVRMEKIT